MQLSAVLSHPETLVLVAVLSVYFIILLRALIQFFFLGGRQRMIEDEKRRAAGQKQQETINGVAKKMVNGNGNGKHAAPHAPKKNGDHPHTKEEEKA